MPAKVVDASVIAAWCFREPRASEALSIVREADLHAPLLLAYELTSIARKKAIAYPENAGLIEKALRTALALPIHWSDVDHLAVMRLALDANLTTYDACYLYVARKAGISLATFDESLEKASRGQRG
jgi:predicted nucleic acid-binding protein